MEETILDKIAYNYAKDAWKQAIQQKIFSAPTLEDAFKAGAKYASELFNASNHFDPELIKSSEVLYFDIDECISDLLKARLEHDSEAEGKALFKMEGLMVATLQQLSCIIEYDKSLK